MIGKKPKANPAKIRPKAAKPRKPRVKKIISAPESPVKFLVETVWEKGFHVTDTFAELIIDRIHKNNPALDILKLSSKQLWDEVRNSCVF